MLEITRVAVASERRPKVDAVRAAVKRIAALQPNPWSHVEIVARSTDSGVRATPLSDSHSSQRSASDAPYDLFRAASARSKFHALILVVHEVAMREEHV